MGQLKSDGVATLGGVTAPGATAITFGELYRINKWNGIALRTIGASDTVRTMDMEIGPRIWYIKIPNITAAVGDLLYWSTGTGFKRGDTDLVVKGTANAVGPAVKIEEAKDANGYAAVRVLNSNDETP